MYNLKYISENGQTINFNPFEGLIITHASGLTSNTVRLAETQGVAQIGATIQSQSVQAKNIIIEGEIVGPATAWRRRLLDTVVPLVPGRLIFDNELFIDVTPQVSPDISRKERNAQFQFTLRAPYPYWRALDITHTDVAGIEPRFKFPINYGDTYFEDPRTHIFGERIRTYFTNVHNAGNVTAPTRIIFNALTAVENPQVLKVETREFIRLVKSMVAGERLVVDMTGPVLRVESTVNGVTKNAMQYFDIDSTLFELDPGTNLLRYDADKNRDGLDCRIIFHDTWAGAYGDDSTFI